MLEPSPRLTILFATETGSASVMAEFAAEVAGGIGIPFRLADAATYDFRSLSSEKRALIITSTHDSEPPCSAADFFDLLDETTDGLHSLQYAVLGLGDTAYDSFCAAAKRVDERLLALGATRISERKDLDAHERNVGRRWISELLTSWPQMCDLERS